MASVSKIGVVVVPARFEALLDAVGRQQIGHVLIEAPDDLQALKAAVVEVRASGQGKLQFLLGPTGIGKTTLAAASEIHLSQHVAFVVTPPPDYDVPLADLPAWLNKNVPLSDRGITVINLDGRELPASDDKARQAAMVNLNAYLRRTKDVLALWPVINRSFAEELEKLLGIVGGASALATVPIYEVKGIPPERYADALQLILSTTGTRLEDAAVAKNEVEALVPDSATLGEFLSKVHKLVVRRYDLGELGAKLPKIYVVVSSNGDSSDACRMLRRGNKYLVDPERLLQFSRANVADDWRRSAVRDARHSVPFIASLFELRVLNLSGSMVVNAAAFSSDEDLKNAIRKHYPNPIKQNAANTIRGSSLARALEGDEDVGPAGGAVSDQVKKAYTALQALSKDHHRAINESIVNVLTEQLKIPMPNLKFEYQPHQSELLRVDCWFERGERPETLEFSHRLTDELSAPAISSYVLSKLRDYARDYQLL